MRFGALAATLIIPAVVLSVGCKKTTPVGKWSGNFNNIPATFEFKEGGQMSVTATAPVVGQVSLSGTWSVDGDKLTYNLTSGNPPIIMTMVGAKVRQSTGAFKIEGDTLTLNSDGTGLPLTRVK